MHDARLEHTVVQSPQPKHSSLFLVVQTCKLEDVGAFNIQI